MYKVIRIQFSTPDGVITWLNSLPCTTVVITVQFLNGNEWMITYKETHD